MTTPVASTNAVAPQTTSQTPSTSSTSTSSANSLSVNDGLASLADNFQSFLSLLTTQLQNQDPLNPTDTNQFTQQITSMTGVEQQLISNQLLQQLVSEQTGVGAAASLMGDTVTAPGAASSDPDISGTVTAITQSNGETMLTVGDNQVPLSSITSITATSNPLASLLGG